MEIEKNDMVMVYDGGGTVPHCKCTNGDTRSMIGDTTRRIASRPRTVRRVEGMDNEFRD